jgi:Ion channel
MKRLVNNMLSDIRTRRLNSWFDRLNFGHIFLIWLGVIVIFGVIFYYVGDGQSLLYSPSHMPVTKFADHVYFSFVTATTTGFGDITPVGPYKIVAILEVVIALLLLAFVTSKLVMIKQDIILNEIYDISFKERITRLRSSLLLFRQNIDRLITKIEDDTVTQREIEGLSLFITAFEETLREIIALFPARRGSYTKNIEAVSRDLLTNSIIHSFEKLEEALTLLDTKQHTWKTSNIMRHVNTCINYNKTLFKQLSTQISEETLTDAISRNEKILDKLKVCMI